MSVPVPLEELRNELGRRANAAYLVTVGERSDAHCVAVVLEWDGEDLVMAAGRTSLRNSADRPAVMLVSPPPGSELPDGGEWSAVGGYTLIVDGEATAATTPGASTVRVRPTHAVLHRPAAAPSGTRLHDCVHVYDEAAGPG